MNDIDVCPSVPGNLPLSISNRAIIEPYKIKSNGKIWVMGVTSPLSQSYTVSQSNSNLLYSYDGKVYYPTQI